jgi:nicotinate-nucleotide adenylyltransferase
VTRFPAAPSHRIGLLGGSFNPAHSGHLAISRAALRQLALDRVVWLVSPRNPLKSESSLAAYDERLACAEAAVAGERRIFVSRFEADHGLRYTIDTLTLLKRTCRQTRFVLLIGADNLVSLPRWKNWTRLFEAVPIAVFARPGWDRAATASRAALRFARDRLPLSAARRLASTLPPAWVFIPSTHDESSATMIREQGFWPAPNRATGNPVSKTPH